MIAGGAARAAVTGRAARVALACHHHHHTAGDTPHHHQHQNQRYQQYRQQQQSQKQQQRVGLSSLSALLRRSSHNHHNSNPRGFHAFRSSSSSLSSASPSSSPSSSLPSSSAFPSPVVAGRRAAAAPPFTVSMWSTPSSTSKATTTMPTMTATATIPWSVSILHSTHPGRAAFSTASRPQVSRPHTSSNNRNINTNNISNHIHNTNTSSVDSANSCVLGINPKYRRQAYTRMEAFDFKHYYNPMHPRLTDEHGMMFPQSSRNQWFWASFQLCVFELRYRVYHYDRPVALPELDFPGVRWLSVPPRPGSSAEPATILAGDGRYLFSITPGYHITASAAVAQAQAQAQEGVEKQGQGGEDGDSQEAVLGLVQAWCPETGRELARLQLPEAGGLAQRAAFLRPLPGTTTSNSGNNSSNISNDNGNESSSSLILITDRLCAPLCWLRFRTNGSSNDGLPATTGELELIELSSEAVQSGRESDSSDSDSGSSGSVQDSNNNSLNNSSNSHSRSSFPASVAALSPHGRWGIGLDDMEFRLYRTRGRPDPANGLAGFREESLDSSDHPNGGVGVAAQTHPATRGSHRVGDLPLLRASSLLIPRFNPPMPGKSAQHASTAGKNEEEEESRPPLVLLTTRSSVNCSVSSAFLHAVDPATGNRQTICWSPDEGVMTGLGYCPDGSHVFVAVTKNGQHLVFEFPVKPPRE